MFDLVRKFYKIIKLKKSNNWFIEIELKVFFVLLQMKDIDDAPLLAAEGNGHHQDKDNSDTKKANGVPIATKNNLA